AADDRTARVWDVEAGTAVLALPHDGSVRQAWLSRDGRWVVTTAEDGQARVWDALGGGLVAGPVPAGVLGEQPMRTPGGRRELRFDDRGVVWLWDGAPCPPSLPPRPAGPAAPPSP